MPRILCLFLALLPFATLAAPADTSPVTGSLQLSHVARDLWRAEYRFDRPVTAVDFGPAVVEFRKQAWTVRTPGLALVQEEDNEAARSTTGRSFRELSIDIRLYEPWSHDAYVPMDRHSDGGTAIYLGHFTGGAQLPDGPRPLALTIALRGLPGETVLLPHLANEGRGVYAYFGPQPLVAGAPAQVLIDPATPAWIRETLADTAKKISAVYAKKLGRTPSEPVSLIVGAGALDATPGYSIKGGAMPGQLVYKLQGRDLLTDTPKVRQRLQQMAAHELAHVWQGLVARGGIGDTQPWVHEGGAEALALQGLLDAGLWTPAQVAEQAASMKKQCQESEARRAADPSLPPSWSDHYHCGFRRFDGAGVDIYALWRRLMERSERSGEPYSEAMFDAALAAP